MNTSSDNFLFYAFDSQTICRDFCGYSCHEKTQIIVAFLLFIIGLLIIIHHVIYPIICILIKKERGSVLSGRIIKGYAAGTLSVGCFVYFIGFCESGTAESTLSLFFRSAISSMEQFVFHSDLLEISEVCHDSAWFMILYTMTYLSAIIVSSIVIINCVKDRISFFFKRIFWSLFRCETIHVFFGVNNRSLALAESIRDIIKHSTKERIVLVSFPKEYNADHGHTSLSKVFGLRPLDKEKVQMIKQMRGIMINASSELFDDTYEEAMSVNVLEHNGLGILIGLLNKAKSIKLYFLSENENENIRAGINIDRSHVLQEHEKHNKRGVEIYCKARRSYENYVLIDHSLNSEFHLIDDSSLAVRLLMTMKDESSIPVAHPINYVTIDHNLGIVNSKFTCLIIGFGQTGQDAMRFFYEFGSFVGKDGGKSPFHCRVVDKNMDKYLGYVASELPSLPLPDEAPSGKPISRDEIDLRTCDVHTAQFWKSLEEKTENGQSFILDVNCIVVAIGTDEENIALAAQLYEFATRHKAINNKANGLLKIFVRTYDMEEQARLSVIEKYYRQERDVIRLFGKIKDIYSYNNIIKNELKEEAKEYFKAYNSAAGNQDNWNDRHNKLRNGSMDEKNEVRIKESQDRSNVLHQYTKQQLLGLTPLPIRPLPTDYPFISNDELVKVCNNDWGNVSKEGKEIKQWYARLQNVSHCEHLRWNASLYMLGFIMHKEKNFRLRQHPCLVGWNETDDTGTALLADYIKKYDYKVVETTILLYQERLKKENCDKS